MYSAVAPSCAVQADAMNVSCSGSNSCSCCKAFWQAVLSTCLCFLDKLYPKYLFVCRPDGAKKAYVRLTTDYDALDVANKIGII